MFRSRVSADYLLFRSIISAGYLLFRSRLSADFILFRSRISADYLLFRSRISADDWTLQINKTEVGDTGQYFCSLNTEPKLRDKLIHQLLNSSFNCFVNFSIFSFILPLFIHSSIVSSFLQLLHSFCKCFIQPSTVKLIFQLLHSFLIC